VHDGDVAGALKDAFHRVHRQAASSLDARLTGAAVTVLLFESDKVWVAHVGDCRAVLGVPDPRPNAEEFHFVPVSLTEDHRLSVKAEFDRAQKHGGDMRRLVNDNTYRLFLQDGDLPGLTLTRSIGDRIGHAIGVCHRPSIGMLKRSDIAEGSFLLLASGGLWAALSERVAVNWVSKHFSNAKEAADTLATEGVRRWGGSLARQSLHPSETDCFSTAVLFLDKIPSDSQDAPLGTSTRTCLEQRPFVLGSLTEKPRLPFKDVKSPARSAALRHVQGYRMMALYPDTKQQYYEEEGLSSLLPQFSFHQD